MKLYLKKPSAEEEQEWKNYIKEFRKIDINATPVSYTHLTLPTNSLV